MKKTVILTLIFIFSFGSFLAANDFSDALVRLYNIVPQLEKRYRIVQDLILQDDRTLEPFYLSALNDLVYGESSYYRENKDSFPDWENLTRALVKELGDIKGLSAASTVWKVVETAETSQLKADALISLGMMRAVDYADEIAFLLRNLNFNTNPDKEGAEKEAFGCVIALGNMKQLVGFEPVLYASLGWYSLRVTDLASPIIYDWLDDPSEELIRIMRENNNYKDKQAILAVVLESKSPVEGKVKSSTLALADAFKRREDGNEVSLDRLDLRLAAIKGLISLEASSPEAVPFLDQSVEEGPMDEKLAALIALGVDGSDGAVDVLVTRLRAFNERQLAGITINQEERLIIRQILFAMGEAGNPRALSALQEMEFSDYTPALIRESKEVMVKISGT